MKFPSTATGRLALHSAIYLLLLPALNSCTNSSHLLLYQHSTLGLNTGVNPSNQSVHARIGIRREFGAIVPKYAIAKLDKESAETALEKPVDDFEAASAYFGSRFRVTSIWAVPEAAEVLATGQAAVLAASKGRLRLKEGHDKVTTESPSTTPEVTNSDSLSSNPIPDVAPLESIPESAQAAN